MPMIEFRCSKCGSEFEELLKSAKDKAPCPSCGSRRVERLLSKVAYSSGGKFVSSVGSGSGCTSCSSSSCSSCSCGH
jgi:putative FmdB family regulatory protein